MKRIAKALSAGAAAAGLLLGTAGVASADDQSYMDYLFARGFTYHPGASAAWQTIQWGQAVCANIRTDGNPRAGFNAISNAMLTDLMIEAAQHELCPDTLGQHRNPHQHLSVSRAEETNRVD
ncbi:DUF732 domain-containing protein [Mycolicibacter virginiensis]|uniref:DUF732 domain-containing protein n=1 Tax=Mycolicibacter virginiensis TaxID=1795032 RepID=UPI001F043BEA|nr:DUF732 domain-containing protein [Mycolicibacter virginiensis]ULP48029.1 DUF732 domain-containing protein [Mycolicibacter virginiensis]